MATNIYGYNTQRITGLASGMDTESLVKNMLVSQQNKIDSSYRSKIKSEWKLAAYTEINSAVSQFRNSYLSILGENSMVSSETYNAYDVTMKENAAIKLTASASTMASSFSITSVTQAKAATVAGKANSQRTLLSSAAGKYTQVVATGAERSVVELTSTVGELAEMFGLEEGQDLSFAIGNGTHTETFTFGADATLQDILDKVNESENAKVTMAFDAETNQFSIKSDEIGQSGDVSFSNVVGKAFSTEEGKGFGIAEGKAAKVQLFTGATKIADMVQTMGTGALTEDGKLEFEINDTAFSINVDENTTVQDLMNTVNAQSGTTGVEMGFNESQGRFTFKNIAASNSSEAISAIKLEGELFGENGLTGIEEGSSSKSGAVSRGDTLAEMAVKLGKTIGDTLTVTVNDKEFSFNTATTTVKSMMQTLSDDAEANVNFNFSEISDTFTLSSDNTGASSALSIEGFGDLFGLESADVTQGSDAVVTMSDGSVIRQSSNFFTLDGLKFEVTGDMAMGAEAVDVSVARNYDSTVKKVKGFVEAYNTMLEKLNTYYNEDVNRKFEPLTEEEEDEVTEKQAEDLTAKAKSGILRNDSTLGTLISGMRSALSVKVGETGMSMIDIGINTTAWNTATWKKDNGKLEVDEKQLRSMLEKDPNAVQSVLSALETNAAGAADTAVTGTGIGATSKSGFITRINAMMGTFNTKMRVDVLVDTAKDVSDFDNKMDEYQDKYAELEERYWKKFSEMETAMSKLTNQNNWLASQLSSL